MSDPTACAAALLDWVELFMRLSTQSMLLSSKEHGLSMPQIGALFQIWHKGSRNVTGLGEHLGVTSAAASQMLERLVNQGLVSRSEDPRDRRLKQVQLTEKGQAVLQEVIRARKSWLDALAAALTPEEQAQVAAALRLLIEKTGQIERRLDLAP